MKKQFLVLFALLAGLGLAVARAFFLTGGIEAETGLVLSGRVLPILNPIVTVAVLVVLLTFILRMTMPKRVKTNRAGLLWLLAELTGGGLLAAMGVTEIIGFFENQSYARLVYGIFALFAALALTLVSLNTKDQEESHLSAYGFWSTVVVFFFCFALVMHFWGHAGQPVLSSYVNGTLALVFSALAAFGVAGFYFRQGKHKRTFYCALAALVFILIELGGFLFSLLFDTTVHPTFALPLGDIFMFGWLLFHMLAVAFGLARGLYSFGLPLPQDTEGVSDSTETPESTESLEKILLDTEFDQQLTEDDMSPDNTEQA